MRVPNSVCRAGRLALALAWLALAASPVAAQSDPPLLGEFLARVPAPDLVDGAEAYGPMRDDIAAAPLLRGGETIGYAFLNSDIVGATGYSGRPIHILAAISPEAVLMGATMLQQSEPLLQGGSRLRDVRELVASYAGRDLKPEAVAGGSGRERPHVSGVSVSVRVVEGSLVRAGLRVAFTLGLGGLEMPERPEGTYPVVNPEAEAPAGWEALLEAGIVRRLELTNATVDRAFAQPGQHPKAVDHPTRGAPEDHFLDLYVTAVSVPGIAAQVLRPAEADTLQRLLEEGGHAILIAARGDYSWRGQAYRYDGVFNRVELVQGDKTIRFSLRDQSPLVRISAEGAPLLTENSILAIPAFAGFDPTAPWQLQVLVQRNIGAIERAYLTYTIDYALPDSFITPPWVTPEMLAAQARAEERAAQVAMRADIWRAKKVEVAGLVTMLAVLTAAFFFQGFLTRSARVTFWFRIAFLSTTLVFLGWYANAQLSVVNLMTLVA
ncbi:MAG: regulatory protein NosR, partial [Rhodobacteraceae bacterium]|nr:regulatory protein NosR [Paracoccaceae bacterium]